MEQTVSHKFLNYWWDSDSEIDPTKTKDDYFKVSYDGDENYIVVERYNRHHHLQSHDEFFWRDCTLIKVEQYNPLLNIEKRIVYKYGTNGELLGREHFSPDGTWLMFESVDE